MRQAFVATLFLCAAQAAHAQTSAPVAIRVRVVDSAWAPIENVEVSVVRELNDALARRMTDRNGIRVLRLDDRLPNYQVVARKVGYLRRSQFLAARNAIP